MSPAVSKKQRRAISIAEHSPGKLHKRNKDMMKMKKSDMHDMAATKEKGLPKKAKAKTRRKKR